MVAGQASPRRFAAAIATRLNRVLPPGFTVRANGTSVDVYAGDQDRHASASATLITERDGRSLAELLETAAWGILDGAQDAIMEISVQQWPVGPDGRAANAGTLVDGDRLLMWYGDQVKPIVTLQPLPIHEILDGAA